MKLIPRMRRPIRSMRARVGDDDPRLSEPERRTPVTMDKRGGMARDDREPSGAVFGLGSRFRLPQHGVDHIDLGAGPASRPYRVTVIQKSQAHRMLGLPLLRLEVVVKRRGQAYRVLEPSTSRFRMRSKATADEGTDPRFHTAGRGGPKVMLEPDEGDER